ncbi:GIY-YIG nuclease family protein [Pasteurella atlantica]|uniref:GIY-YIG nuclease family protein n=1 Tax=Pasteurellaceae TaxID=712 RepID=UPI002772111D|nr:GIY-YIG nuclease family protein [Pasteurella atlantica]MDP8099372.1 GIY-YIG nuclease family protein [Pasteurella atlantica]MDP8107490.1 GIY-YIG nuclease family protein [Pasteurella atlantica]MDP8117241.1 GIY-YIG nuclease family protein [Pasteurella atlantica]
MGKTIITHFLEGTPKGIQSVQISNKTIMGFVIPRVALKKAQEIDELIGSPSLYILIGEGKNAEPQAYIGQTDDFLARIIDHNQKKDFWNKALVFISQTVLNKAEVLYLEYVALQYAKENGTYTLNENKQNPKEPKLQRHVKDTLNDFFIDVRFITEFLNYPLFKTAEQHNQKIANIDYFYTARNSRSKGFYDENGFTVVKGSIISQKETPSFKNKNALEKRHQLIEQIVDKTGYEWVLKVDYTFTSPSSAATFCIGSNSNGWIEWKNSDGKTLDEIYRK